MPTLSLRFSALLALCLAALAYAAPPINPYVGAYGHAANHHVSLVERATSAALPQVTDASVHAATPVQNGPFVDAHHHHDSRAGTTGTPVDAVLPRGSDNDNGATGSPVDAIVPGGSNDDNGSTGTPLEAILPNNSNGDSGNNGNGYEDNTVTLNTPVGSHQLYHNHHDNRAHHDEKHHHPHREDDDDVVNGGVPIVPVSVTYHYHQQGNGQPNGVPGMGDNPLPLRRSPEDKDTDVQAQTVDGAGGDYHDHKYNSKRSEYDDKTVTANAPVQNAGAGVHHYDTHNN